MLETGQKYSIAHLRFEGWTRGDGSGHDGYRFADYFGRDGTYLGPDEHGIEPMASWVPAFRCDLELDWTNAGSSMEGMIALAKRTLDRHYRTIFCVAEDGSETIVTADEVYEIQIAGRIQGEELARAAAAGLIAGGAA